MKEYEATSKALGYLMTLCAKYKLDLSDTTINTLLRKHLCKTKFNYTLPIVARDTQDQGEKAKIIRNFRVLHCSNGYNVPNLLDPNQLHDLLSAILGERTTTLNAGSGESALNRNASQCVTASVMTAVLRNLTHQNAVRSYLSPTVYGRLKNPVELAKNFLYKVENGAYVVSDLFKKEGMTSKQIREAAENTYVKAHTNAKTVFIKLQMNITWVCRQNSQKGGVDVCAEKQAPLVNHFGILTANP